MKRALILSAALGLFVPFTMMGCSEETKNEEKTKVSTPTGTDEKTVTTTEKKTGDEKENK